MPIASLYGTPADRVQNFSVVPALHASKRTYPAVNSKWEGTENAESLLGGKGEPTWILEEHWLTKRKQFPLVPQAHFCFWICSQVHYTAWSCAIEQFPKPSASSCGVEKTQVTLFWHWEVSWLRQQWHKEQILCPPFCVYIRTYKKKKKNRIKSWRGNHPEDGNKYFNV